MWNAQPTRGDNWDWLWLHTDRWKIRCCNRIFFFFFTSLTPPTQHPPAIHQFILACGQYRLRVRGSFFRFLFLPSALNYRERKNQGTFLKRLRSPSPSSLPLCLHVLATLNAIPQQLDYEWKWLMKPSHSESATASLTWSNTLSARTYKRNLCSNVSDRQLQWIPSKFSFFLSFFLKWMWIFFLFFVFWNARTTNTNSDLTQQLHPSGIHFHRPPLEGVTIQVFSQPIAFLFSTATEVRGDRSMPFTTSIHFRRVALTSPKEEMKRGGCNWRVTRKLIFARVSLELGEQEWLPRQRKTGHNATGATVLIRKRAWLHTLTPRVL